MTSDDDSTSGAGSQASQHDADAAAAPSDSFASDSFEGEESEEPYGRAGGGCVPPHMKRQLWGLALAAVGLTALYFGFDFVVRAARADAQEKAAAAHDAAVTSFFDASTRYATQRRNAWLGAEATVNGVAMAMRPTLLNSTDTYTLSARHPLRPSDTGYELVSFAVPTNGTLGLQISVRPGGADRVSVVELGVPFVEASTGNVLLSACVPLALTGSVARSGYASCAYPFGGKHVYGPAAAATGLCTVRVMDRTDPRIVLEELTRGTGDFDYDGHAAQPKTSSEFWAYFAAFVLVVAVCLLAGVVLIVVWECDGSPARRGDADGSTDSCDDEEGDEGDEGDDEEEEEEEEEPDGVIETRFTAI
jgi:hypothetical protein